jgi:uncharacterized SAM-binding protein YcdF (DUF218 family)
MSDLISYGFLTPPAVLILVSAAAAWLTLWNPRLGIAIGIVTTSLLYLAALPVVSTRMLQEVEVTTPPPPADFSTAQAIVVLGGGVHKGDGDKVPDTLGVWTLERVVFAARAYRELHLKVAVTGGRVGSAHTSEASLMKAVLEGDFNVPVTWAEPVSRSTWENAVYTAKLLKPENIKTIVLVTHAWHMRRAIWSFERAGLHVLPWPAPETYDESSRIDDYLPSAGALESSFHALHEAIGLAYYRFRYGSR